MTDFVAEKSDKLAHVDSQVEEGSIPPVKRSFFRSTLFQMLIVGVTSFLAPGLWNAINSLGAAGALQPYLVNGANSLVFGLMGALCILGAIPVNLIGIKYTLVLGTIGYIPYSASLYQNNRYGTEWFVLFGAVLCGISGGLYWAAEGAIVLSYPEHKKRGRYLAIWLAFKNSGQIVGGAINLGINIHRSTGGKVSYATLLVFVVLQILALPASFLISSPQKVQRDDGTKVKIERQTSTLVQFKAIWQTMKSRKIGFLLPMFFSSWFYWGYGSTYLTLYFSVRARALASLLSAVCGVFATTLLGYFLDSQRWTVKQRARYAGVFVFTVFSGMLIWALVIQHAYIAKNPGHMDWTDAGFGRGFGMYIMINTAGNLVQNYLYWTVGSIGDGTAELTRLTGILRGVEAWGQCVSFGINSSKFNPLYTVVINAILWAVSVPPAWMSVVQVGVGESVHTAHERALESESSSAAEEKSAASL